MGPQFTLRHARTQWDRSWARHHMIKRPGGYCFRTVHTTQKRKNNNKKRNLYKTKQTNNLSSATLCHLQRYFVQFPAAECKLVWLQMENMIFLPSRHSGPLLLREGRINPLFILLLLFSIQPQPQDTRWPNLALITGQRINRPAD